MRVSGDNPHTRALLTILVAFVAAFMALFVVLIPMALAGVPRGVLDPLGIVVWHAGAIIGGVVYYRRSKKPQGDTPGWPSTLAGFLRAFRRSKDATGGAPSAHKGDH